MHEIDNDQQGLYISVDEVLSAVPVVAKFVIDISMVSRLVHELVDRLTLLTPWNDFADFLSR